MGGAEVGTETKQSQLTRRRPNPLGDHGLVPPGCLAQGFISGTYADNGEQGHDEAEVGCDVPLAEDDAEVVGRPSEEHLTGSVSERQGPLKKTDIHFAHVAAAAMVHVSVVHAAVG